MEPDFRPVDHIFPERRKAIKADRCSFCGGEAFEFTDDLSRKEYTISGMCQTCQDKFYE